MNSKTVEQAFEFFEVRQAVLSATEQTQCPITELRMALGIIGGLLLEAKTLDLRIGFLEETIRRARGTMGYGPLTNKPETIAEVRGILEGGLCTNRRHGLEYPMQDWKVGDPTKGFCVRCLQGAQKVTLIEQHVSKHGINPIGGC